MPEPASGALPSTSPPRAAEAAAPVAVTLVLPSALHARVGERGTLSARGETVRAVLASVAEQYPSLGFALCEETGRLRPYVNIFLNGRNIRYLRDLDTPLPLGAVLHVMPSVAGG